jgi:hypothetical protein
MSGAEGAILRARARQCAGRSELASCEGVCGQRGAANNKYVPVPLPLPTRPTDTRAVSPACAEACGYVVFFLALTKN